MSYYCKMHRFWNNNMRLTQPNDKIKETPLTLPSGYEWCSLDLNDNEILDKCCEFLRNNYVSDGSGTFRFKYSKELIKWATMTPGYKKDWHVGVMANGKLCGCIFGVPVKIFNGDKVIDTCEINFLCVHKKLRSMRLTPVLIKEVTRRVNLDGVFQAVYTAGIEIPTVERIPTRYSIRNINIRKLVDVKFMFINEGQMISDVESRMKVPPKVNTIGWREMTSNDVVQVHGLLENYLSKFKLHIRFTLTDVFHTFIPLKDVVSSYVVEVNDKITDFASFFHLPSTITGNNRYDTLYSAYSYYNVPGSLAAHELMENLIIEANYMSKDAFIALNIMDNEKCFERLNFSVGTAGLNYYLYNFSGMNELSRSDIGIVLV